MSVTIALGLVFFYNGWHSENARNAKTLKEMQRKFDETVDFRSLKNLPEWCVVLLHAKPLTHHAVAGPDAHTPHVQVGVSGRREKRLAEQPAEEAVAEDERSYR